MRKTTRAVLLAAAGALALASAGSALASFSPKLWASAGTGVTIKVQVGAADDPTAKVSIYAPVGYQLKDPPPAGTVLGAITAQASAVDLGGAILPLTGDLVAADPAQYTGPPNNVCVPGAHAQVWILNLTAAGQTLQVPMYVDPTSGAAAAFASFTIQVCLPPPDVPVGTPGRATFGAKLLSAEFTSSAVTPSATGGLFHSLWTPYTPAKGTPNQAGTVEAQAKVGSPASLTLSGKKTGTKKAKRATLTARLAPAAAGTTVTFLAGGKKVASAKTNAGGIAVASVRLLRTTSFTATATAPDADLGSAGCAATVPGSPFPCVDSTSKGSKTTSKAVRVKA
ncbi:MAG TPA: hypothetical protein VIU86_11045 [Gaiellaceae bacterium]